MEEKKVDYVAVPTTDSVVPAAPNPAPFHQCCVNGQPRRRRFCLVKFIMLGAAIGYIFTMGASVFSSVIIVMKLNDGQSTMSPMRTDHGRPVAEFGYPSDLPGSAQMKELDDFFGELHSSVGPNHRPHFAPECCAQSDSRRPFKQKDGELMDDKKKEHGRHHHHHRHSHKHHGDDDKKGDHQRGHCHHHNDESDSAHHKKSKGCPCFAPPPPPPEAVNHFVPAEQLGDDERPHFPPAPPSFCPPEVELNATSTVFKFSPEEFGRAAVLIGDSFADSGDVVFTKSVSNDVDSVAVNVTVLHGSDFILKKVDVDAFDHKGQFVIELKHNHHPHRSFPHPPPPPFHKTPGDLCLKYIVNVVFPSNVHDFEEFKLRAKQAKVSGDKSISGVTFEKFVAGVGRGYLNFDGLRAKAAKLGVIAGHIRGSFETTQRLSTGVVRGSTEIQVVPADEAVKISAAVGKGHNSVAIPADTYKGDFAVHSLLEGTPSVSAPNPADVHVIKYSRSAKAGYYKEKDTGSVVAVHTKHGDSNLSFV
ncbi:hypothetical protein BX666DRAFT_1877263 [Dichotomocladium elegans]|nr:hypothetical protein BX666DRAFT_1877263 [Dichotomocladium elegans]